MASILDQIVEQTETDLRKRKNKVSFKDFESFDSYERPRRAFGDALKKGNHVSIIAEIKKASPSKGVIRKDFNPSKIARQYQEGGASALSVLTDEPAFQGSLKDLESVSETVALPVLRKDFIVDPYQVKEARAYGADAVLLIVAITEGSQLSELLHAAKEFELDCLVECYSEKDFNRVDFNMVSILGVNNRDLKNFEVDLHRGVEILQKAPGGTCLVSESGLGSANDLKLLCEQDIHAALIGEHFMRRRDPGKAVKEMLEELENLIEVETEQTDKDN